MDQSIISWNKLNIFILMKNFNVADHQTYDLMCDLMNNINQNDSKLYIHCNSGHGRSYVVSALLLQCVYG